ncbi:MAG TPA: hypothetical protein VNJ08_11940 [Bacteriovoracaceae bacterium]|nr:hypothetical protein [Bacteriovoracaceae bacterium]
MIKLIVFSFLFILSKYALAAEKVYFKLPYIVEQNDTLESIFLRFIYNDRVIGPEHQAYERTIKENPHVTDWKSLVIGTPFDLFIPIDDLDKAKYQAYLLNAQEAAAKLVKGPEGLKGSIFYMASFGKFTQKDTTAAEVEFYQNSPFSVGTALSFYPKNTRWSFAASAYFSYLLASGNNLDGSDVKVPPEIGGNLYHEYKFVEKNFTGYYGLDYERFSTFNMGAIQNNHEILLDNNTVLYLTVGVSRSIQLFDHAFFNKLSFSKSLSTTTETHPQGFPVAGGYDGYKIMWYLNKKISPSMFIHSLFKFHAMSGPSELTTLRLGVGFGYIFL